MKLTPNWLADEFDQINAEIMANRDAENPLTSIIDVEKMRREITEKQKYQLLAKLDARFAGWTGESIDAFKARRSALAAARQGGGDV